MLELNFTLLLIIITFLEEEVDQTPVFEKEKDFTEEIDVADEVLADAGEG